MLAIIDSRAPAEAISNLRQHVDGVLLFHSEEITSNAISGHPDIFIYQDQDNLIVAPNAPTSLIDFFKKHRVHFIFGETNVTEDFEGNVRYNCLGTSHYFLHREGFTEPAIFRLITKKEFIHLPQAYTRCSLTHLGNDQYITSDKGIEKKLKEKGLDCFYFSPEEISIIGHPHGFFGGTNGLWNGKLFFIGNIDLHQNGGGLRKYIAQCGIEIISLSNTLLYDGGGIFFIPENNSGTDSI
ncbi:MAG TPA: hypothetical protein VII99_02775 [Bacteroidia bacterium]